MTVVSLVFLSVFTSSILLAAEQFHEGLTHEELRHYFGTTRVDGVPLYAFTSPQPVAGRDRRASTRLNLEYLVDVFGEMNTLLLDENRDLIAPGCLVQHLDKDGIRATYPCLTMDGCFYTGRISDKNNSWVSASVCGGFHAVIGTSNNTYIVQPVMPEHRDTVWRNTDYSDPHIVYMYRRTHPCHMDGIDTANAHTKAHREGVRSKRSSTRKYIETAAVVCPDVFAFHGNGTEQYVKNVLNVAAERFLDPSLQTELYMSLVKLIILEENQKLRGMQESTSIMGVRVERKYVVVDTLIDAVTILCQEGLIISIDAAVTLTSLCEWQYAWNPRDDSDPEHADYVILITRLDLVHSGDTATLGLAKMGMCSDKSKCSVNEDTGLGTGLTLAHETGHTLGMHHDGFENNCSDGVNIMSSIKVSGSDSLKWSNCSVDQLVTALSSLELDCLNDEPPATADKPYDSTVKPGTMYTANDQCRLMRGEMAEVCDVRLPDGQDICSSLICRDQPNTGVLGCIIYSDMLMDGTDCYNNRTWCIGGVCVAMGPDSPGPVNGGWSDWPQDYSVCSRTCGGGVKHKKRYCNNPEPMYGGKLCEGLELVAMMCNVQPCETSQTAFLQEQCAATDDESFGDLYYHWTYYYYDQWTGDDTCQLTCNAAGTNWFTVRGLAKHGSICYSDEEGIFHRCVFGKCKVFGCDGHMDSGLVFDQCAVCNGSGDTCTKVSGNFSGGTHHVFNTFVQVPAGSTGIQVTQGNAFCFLSIQVGSESLFSTSSVRSKGIYVVNGTTVEYTKNPESLKITGPIKHNISLQVYKSYDSQIYVGVDPAIEFEYYTPIDEISVDIYTWDTKQGQCSKECGTGVQSPNVTCINKTLAVVDEKFCNIDNKPSELIEECNTHDCPPRWRSSQWSKCSQTCGGGNKHREVDCVTENNDIEKILSPMDCTNLTKPIESTSCNSDECPGLWSVGSWSDCSEHCARGTRIRSVNCVSADMPSDTLEESRCSGTVKPPRKEYCILKPCRVDFNGSTCVDKSAECSMLYEEGVCHIRNNSWASDNCMRTCGVCSKTPIEYSPDCQDILRGCDYYDDEICIKEMFRPWAEKCCKRHCQLCENLAVPATEAPAVCKDLEPDCMQLLQDGQGTMCKEYRWFQSHCAHSCGFCLSKDDACEDRTDCAAYGEFVCELEQFSHHYCRKHCGLCDVCIDQLDNCETYGSSICETELWAELHCRAFCGFCTGRNKRSVKKEPPPLPVETEHKQLELRRPEIKKQKKQKFSDEVHDYREMDALAMKSFVNPKIGLSETKIPRSVCNTILTLSRNNVEVRKHAIRGMTCEQIIVLPHGRMVYLEFKQINVICESGDQLTIIDGITNKERDGCNITPNETIQFNGSIVAIKFTPGVTGHGYLLSYLSIQQRDLQFSCVQQFVNRHGEIKPMAFPVNFKSSSESCEIYVIGTPGKGIRFHFMNAIVPRGECEVVGLKVEDLDNTNTGPAWFCDEKFTWMSQGPRVRISYSQQLDFTAIYSVE